MEKLFFFPQVCPPAKRKEGKEVEMRDIFFYTRFFFFFGKRMIHHMYGAGFGGEVVGFLQELRVFFGGGREPRTGPPLSPL